MEMKEKYFVYEKETERNVQGVKRKDLTFLGETFARSPEEAIKNVKYRQGIHKRNVWSEDFYEMEIVHEYIALDNKI